MTSRHHSLNDRMKKELLFSISAIHDLDTLNDPDPMNRENDSGPRPRQAIARRRRQTPTIMQDDEILIDRSLATND